MAARMTAAAVVAADRARGWMHRARARQGCRAGSRTLATAGPLRSRRCRGKAEGREGQGLARPDRRAVQVVRRLDLGDRLFDARAGVVRRGNTPERIAGADDDVRI